MALTALAKQNWHARLELGFAKRPGSCARTAPVHRRHVGPLSVQRPFYPEGETCHIYLLHPPGGVVGGDRLEIDVCVEHNAHALITTPASGKFYRSAGALAEQHQHLRVLGDGVLEWLPQDTILFSGSQVAMTTHVELSAQARFIGWDIVCFGRPASNDRYHDAHCRQAFELWRSGRPLIIERAAYQSESNMMSAPWGLNNHTAVGTFVISNADNTLLEAARAVAIPTELGMLSATLIDDVLVCRMLGHQGMQTRETFTRIWQAIRPVVLGMDACVPRIWNT